MANPFQGDAYFKDNPTKVLGEQFVQTGRFGSEFISVKGSIDDLQRIDASPIKPVDILINADVTVENKQELIDKVFDNVDYSIKDAEHKKIRTGRLKKDITTPENKYQEVYDFKEISDLYNKDISQDEMEAYYYSHPELNYKLLFDEFANSKDQLISKGLICFDTELSKFVYVYTYQSGNVSKKISNLKRDKDEFIDKYGEDQYDKQIQMLESVLPKNKTFIGEERIILLPHSNFAKEHKIDSLRYKELGWSRSLFDAFKEWLREIPTDRFKKSTYREVINYYLDNDNISINKNQSKENQIKDEKNAINLRQRTKEEGDELFASFLADELTPEDQSRIAYLWNEKFNSIVEPNLLKVPVCFKISKTFKNNVPFRLNPTQRQAVAFEMEKFSGLFAYGVGVGKTASAIACLAQSYYNSLAKKFLFVVPTNTYDKWIGEIQGYTDKKTGVYMHGLLPQLPEIVGLYNLNPTIVRETLKNYSKVDELKFLAIEEAIIEVKKLTSDDLSDKEMKKISSLHPINFGGIGAEYNSYVYNSKAANPRKFREFIVDYLRDEYNYLIYNLGEIKSFPDGTIFVTTEIGLQRFGVSEENQSELSSQLYKILSQGEDASDKNRAKVVAALQLRIEQTVSSSMKNAKLNIEDIGVDWACFDESHLYKKLFTYVKGSIKNSYSNGEGGNKNQREKTKYELKSGAYPSQRALSAFVVSHYIQSNNNNRNVIQLTATPFTNSPLEVFSMLVLTNYKALQDLGLDNMTDFFDTFMRINYDIKYTPQKTVVKDIVLTGYNNLSQLRQVIYSLMDKKDSGSNIVRPNKIMYPSIAEGRDTTLPMTDEQNMLMSQVKSYIQGNKEYDKICSSALKEDIENIDFDAVDDDALIFEWERVTGKEFDGEREKLSDSKRDVLVKQIKNATIEGVELDDEELSEEESLGVRILKGLSMMRQITLSPYLYYKACKKSSGEVAELPNYKDYIYSSPKLRYVLGCVKSVIDFHKGKEEKVSGQVIYMNAGVDYFPLIKEFCVKEINLKPNQIGIVSGGMSKTAKENIKQGFLRGDIVVLIGSSTICMGVDLQDNATTLYNCYYDWNPTDAAQIEGRIWRQGNRFANVRIVYPQCYNSADPVIFEYLNAKTLRINEIWNRSSDLQELDLRDFNPKELQKKLITDPEELAEWQILEQRDAVESQIIFLENRRESLTKAFDAYKKANELRPQAIQYLHELSSFKLDREKEKLSKVQSKKIAEIEDKYANDPIKLGEEMQKYLKSRYNHEADPLGRFKPTNYSKSSDTVLLNDSKKWAAELYKANSRWDNESKLIDSSWGDYYYNSSKIETILDDFRSNMFDTRRAEEVILKPMGLSFETVEDPIIKYDENIANLQKELQDIEDGKQDRINKIKEEFLARGVFDKTVEDRVDEFAAANERYLSDLLIASPKEDDLKPLREETFFEPAEKNIVDIFSFLNNNKQTKIKQNGNSKESTSSSNSSSETSTIEESGNENSSAGSSSDESKEEVIIETSVEPKTSAEVLVVPEPTQKEIISTIKGLKILADFGDKDALATIKGLKLLLI